MLLLSNKKRIDFIFFTFITVILLTCITWGQCYSMERKWQWIRSDENYGYFIDVEDAYNHKVDGNEVDYSDVWVKVAYTYNGAQDEINYFGLNTINANTLKDGYGLYKLRLHYLSGEVDYLHLSFYDKNGNLLKTVKQDKTTIYGERFLEPILLFMSSKITGGKEFSLVTSGKAIKQYKCKTPSGQVRLFNVPISSIIKRGNRYSYVFDERTSL